MPSTPISRSNRPRATPGRVVRIFLSLGLAWVWLSDLVLYLAGELTLMGMATSAGKGSGFVVACAVLIYWLVRREYGPLAKAESLLRSVLDGNSDAVFAKGTDGRYLVFNAAASRFVGKPVEDVLGYDDTHLFDEAGARLVMERDRQVLETGEAQTAEETITASGVTRTYLATKAPLRDAIGNIIGVTGISRDITELKQATDAVRRYSTLYKTIIDTAWEGICVCREIAAPPFLEMTVWNDRLVELTGYTQEEINRLGWFEAMCPDPDQRQRAWHRLTQLRAEGQLMPEEWCITRKDNKKRIVTIRTSYQTPPDESPFVVAFFEDVTERIEAVNALRESEERLRVALEAASAIAFVWDVRTDRVTRYFSREPALPATGDQVEYLSDVRRKIHPDDLKGFDSHMQSCIHSGTSDYYNVYRVMRQDGTSAWLEEFGRLDREDSGQPLRLTGVSIDITQRVQAETSIRQSEERFRSLVESGYEGINILDPSGREIYSSPRNRTLVGLLPGESDDNALGFVHPDDAAEARAALAEVIATPGHRVERRLRLVRRDGSIFWVEAQARNLLDHPAVGGIVVNWRDLTERLAAETKLRESEERYRRLLEMLPISVHVVDNGHITYCNPACTALHGADCEEELRGLTPFDLVHPDYHQLLEARIDEVAKTPHPPITTFKIQRRDGEVRIVEAVARSLSEQTPNTHVVCLQDISDRERAAILLRSVLASVGEAILTAQVGGSIHLANDSAVRMLGYDLEDLLRRNLRELVVDESDARSSTFAEVLPAMKKSIKQPSQEVEVRRFDGSTFPAEFSVTEFQLEGVRHFTVVFRDITERKRLEAQFRQAQKMEAIGRLAGGVAHDFNNLLTVITGYCDLALEGLPAGDDRREYMAAIRDAGERAARLTQQLLAFSRKAVVEPRILDLNELLTEAVGLLRRLIGEDIQLAVRTDDRLPCVRVDPSQLEQVILNLAVNARDAMPTGGRLTLQTYTEIVDADRTDRKPGTYARLRVTDTGCGMTDDVKAHLFEPFFTTKEVGKGTGLGLAVVHGVVEGCGGWIEVESTVGHGTCFDLAIPAVEVPVPARGNEGLRVGCRGDETLLLVEDEPAVRTIARLALEMQGYTVLEAGDCREAEHLSAAQSGEIDLLVSDVVLPETSGQRLLETLRQRRPGLRVLFMSGYTDDALGLHGVSDANNTFIQKPFTPLSLARKVRAVLDLSKS